MSGHKLEPITRRVARQAAEWWADIYRDTPRPFDNGDASTSAMATMMLALSPAGDAPTEEVLSVFVDAFVSGVVAQIYQGDSPISSRYSSARAGIDYHPHGVLADAIAVAGLQRHPRTVRLPVKTQMYIMPMHVEVAAGYGAPWKTIVDARTPALRLGEAYAHLGEMLREQEEAALFGKTRRSAEELGQRVADARAQVAALEVVK